MHSALDYVDVIHTGLSAVKARGVFETAAGTKYRVGGLLVTFSDTSDPDDSENRDIFTPETDFCITDGQRTIIWYHHGQGKKIKRTKVGYGSLKRVPKGVEIDGVLEGPYAETLYNAVERGDLGWSSGTVYHLVDRTPVRCDDGGTCHVVTHWPLGIDASLTPMPAYPNTAKGYGAMKALVDVAELAEVELEPTEAQKEAGNYRKGHVTIDGIKITIENPKGSVRRGVDPDGTPWENTMMAHYGYIKRSKGADGDHVDVFVGDHEADHVYIIDQVGADGTTFDEHKVILGVRSREEATQLYQSHYPSDWRVGPITELSIDEFKEWLAIGDTTQPLSAVKSQAAESKPKRGGYGGPGYFGSGGGGFYEGGTPDNPLPGPYIGGPRPGTGPNDGGKEEGGASGGGGSRDSGEPYRRDITNQKPTPDPGYERKERIYDPKCIEQAMQRVPAPYGIPAFQSGKEFLKSWVGRLFSSARLSWVEIQNELAKGRKIGDVLADVVDWRPSSGDLKKFYDAYPSIVRTNWRNDFNKVSNGAALDYFINLLAAYRECWTDPSARSSAGTTTSQSTKAMEQKNITDHEESLVVMAWWAPTRDRITLQDRETFQWIGNLPIEEAATLGIDAEANDGYLGAYVWQRDRFEPLEGDGVPDSMPALSSGGSKTAPTVLRSVYLPTDMIGVMKPTASPCRMIWDPHFGPEPHWPIEALLERWSGGEREPNPYGAGDILPAQWQEIAVDLCIPSIEEIMERAQLPRANAVELLEHLYRCRRAEALEARRRRAVGGESASTSFRPPAAKGLMRVTATRHRWGAVLIDQATGRFVDNVSVPQGTYLYDPETRNVYSELPFLSDATGAMKKTATPVVQKVFCDASDPERACACWDYNKYGVAGPSNASEIFEDLEHCKGSGIYYIVDGGWRPAIRKESDGAIVARRLYLSSGTHRMQSTRQSAKCSCGCGACSDASDDETESFATIPRALEPLLLAWDDEWEGKALKTPRGADAGCWATVLAAFYRDSRVDAGDRILEAFASGEVAFPHSSLKDYVQRGKTFSGWTGKNPGRDYLPAEFRAAYKNWHSPSASADTLYRVLLAYFNCLKVKLTAPQSPVAPTAPRLASDLFSAKTVVAGAGLVPPMRDDHHLSAPQGVNLPCWVEACQQMLHDIGANNGALGRDVIEALASGAVAFPQEWEQFARMKRGQADAIDAWLESHDPEAYVPSQYRSGTNSWVAGAGHAVFVLLMYYKRCVERMLPTGAPVVNAAPARARVAAATKSQASARSGSRRTITRLTGDSTLGFYEGGTADNPLSDPYTGGSLGDGTGGVPNRDYGSGQGYGGGSGAGNDHYTPPLREETTDPVPFTPKDCVWPYEQHGYPAPVFSEAQLQLLLDGGVTLSTYTGINGNTDQFYQLGVDGEEGGLPNWESLLEAAIQRNNANPNNDHVDPADDNALDSLKDQAIDDWRNYLKCCAEEYRKRKEVKEPPKAPKESHLPLEEGMMVAPEDAEYWDEECWSESIEGNGAPDWILRAPETLPWAALYDLYRPILGKSSEEQTDYADRTDLFSRILHLLQSKQQVEDQELDDMGAVLDRYFSCWWRKHGDIKPEEGGVPVNGRLVPLPSALRGPSEKKSLTFPGARRLRSN